MLSPLRDLTRAEHESVDRLFSRFDLSRLDQYRAFLRAQASAHLAVEAALDQAEVHRLVPDWPDRRRAPLIGADLADLRVEPRNVPAPALRAPAEMLGGVYVLEGSRLGGAFLSARIPSSFPSRFLAAPARPGSWRNLLILMQARLADPAELGLAAASARVCFGCFEEAGKRELELMIA